MKPLRTSRALCSPALQRVFHLTAPSRFAKLLTLLIVACGAPLAGCSLALDFKKFAEECTEEEARRGLCVSYADIIAALLEEASFDEAETTEFSPPAAGESIVFTGLISEAPRKESTFTFKGRAGQWLEIEAYARDQLVPEFRIRRAGDEGRWRESPRDESAPMAARKLFLFEDGDYELHLAPSHTRDGHEGGRFIVRMTQLLPPTPHAYEAHKGDLLELDENFYILDFEPSASVHQLEARSIAASAEVSLFVWHEGFVGLRELELADRAKVRIAPETDRTYMLVDYFSASHGETAYELRALERFCDAEGEPFGGGAGDADEPARICTPEHLAAINTNLSGHYLLTRHLEMADIEFIPIGRDSSGFSGVFDGDGFSIRELEINETEDLKTGLFTAILPGAIVKNLVFRSPQIIGEINLGVVAGENQGTIARIAIIDGTVAGVYGEIGGIVGLLSGSGTISESIYHGKVSGGSAIGGIAGSAEGLGNATVSNSYVLLEGIRTRTNGGEHGAGIIGNLRGSQGRVVSSYTLPAEGIEVEGTFSPIASNVSTVGDPPNRVENSYYLFSPLYTDTAHGAGLLAEAFAHEHSFEEWNFTSRWFMDPEAEPFARPRLRFERELQP